MPINIPANVPTAVIAIQTVSFASIGLNTSNIYIIHQIGNPPKSWRPDRAINAITGFIEGEDYIIYSKIDLDLSPYVVPPLSDDFTELKNWTIANFSPLAHTHTASDIVSGVLSPSRLGTGIANGTKILYGDGTWKDEPENTSIFLVDQFIVGESGAAMANGDETFTDTFIMGATANQLRVVVDEFELFPNRTDRLSYSISGDTITFTDPLIAGTSVKVFFWI